MDRNNSKTLLVKVAGFLGVASLSVLISLPGLSQQSPDNTNPNVPSTVKPTNPGGRDAGTTNGGESLNRVPTSGNQVPSVGNQAPSDGSMNQRNSGSMEGQTGGTSNSADPASTQDPINRVEGRDQGTPSRMNSSPNGSNGQRGTNQPGANQPGATTGGDSSQQVERSSDPMQQNSGSMQRRTQQAPQSGGQYQPQQDTQQTDTNSGSTTDSQSTTRQDPTDSSVRALW